MKSNSTHHLLILLAIVFTHCGINKSDESAAADTINSTGMINDTLAVAPETVNSTSVMILKWKEVSISEFGPTYVFEDTLGNEVYFTVIEIPGFDFQKNKYFNTIYENDNPLPTVTLRPEIINVWFTVIIKKKVRELDEGDGEVSIIVAMNPNQ